MKFVFRMSRQINLSKPYSFEETSFDWLSLSPSFPPLLTWLCLHSLSVLLEQQNTWFLNCASRRHLDISQFRSAVSCTRLCKLGGFYGHFLFVILSYSHESSLSLLWNMQNALISLCPVNRSFSMWTFNPVLNILCCLGHKQGPYILITV